MSKKKLDYSNVMTGLPENERLGMWGKDAYIYRGLYIDKDDDRAFKNEEEVDKAIEEATVAFRKEYGLES